MSTQDSVDKVFEVICNSLSNLDKFYLFHLAGLSGSGELSLLDRVKNDFQKDIFLLTPHFKIEYLWDEENLSSKKSYEAYLTTKIKEKNIIICENWFLTDLEILKKFYEIMVYCSKFNMKKLFILNCTIPILYECSTHSKNFYLLMQNSLPSFSYTLQPLSDLYLNYILEKDDEFRNLSDKNKKAVVSWSNGNEILLKEIASSLKAYSLLEQKELSLIIEENETIADVYDRLYGKVITSLTDNLCKVLDMAIVSGIDIYTDILKELNRSYICDLMQIEQNTHIIKIKDNTKRIYTFANDTIYDVLKKRTSKCVISEYSLILIDTIDRILNQNVSSVPRIILLEKINGYLEYSLNEGYKHYYCNQLINEYFLNRMYDKCLNFIKSKFKIRYSQLKRQFPDIALKSLRCRFELENFDECIELLKKSKKLSIDEKLIYLQSYYRIGNPKKVIQIYKTYNISGWSNEQKIQLYSLLMGCYEWLDKHSQLVKFYSKSFRLAALQKNEQYYQLLRKSNIAIDSLLPEFILFMNEAISYFKGKKDFKSCAWCLHNWGTEQILKLKEAELGFQKLMEAKAYLDAQLSIDRFDVENSIAIYYMLKGEWQKASDILNSIINCSNLDFCNIAYKLNLFHCLRKLNLNEKSKILLTEIDMYFESSKYDSSLNLQWQNFCVSKAIFLLDSGKEEEALELFIKAILCMKKDYKSYYSYIAAKNILKLISHSHLIKKNILDLSEYFGQSIEPICIKLNDENITIAEIMFWN